MNRHERRPTAKLAGQRTKAWNNKFVTNYVEHLPEVPPNAPEERGRVYHIACYHDDNCAIYGKAHGTLADCTCNPVVRKFVEPRRS
jgi:hypothetical protein